MAALTAYRQDSLAEVQKDFGKEMKKFTSVLPAHVKPERFLRVVVMALTLKPELLDAPRDVILNECLRCASDGLIPDGKEAALVPRYGREFSLTYQPMIAGIKKKVRNSGEVSTWDVVAVRANDVFEFGYGLEPYLRHTYDIRAPRGEMIAVYSVATLKDGTKTFDIMSKEDVDRIRDRSDAYKAFVAKKIKSTPWDSDYEEMAKKTVAKRHSKDLPSSTDLDKLLYTGDHDRQTIDYGDISLPTSQPKGLAGRLEDLGREDDEVDHDPTTGEIRDETNDKDGGSGKHGDRAAARADGKKAGLDGVPRRKMPKDIRDHEDDQMAAAWIEGWEEGDQEGDQEASRNERD